MAHSTNIISQIKLPNGTSYEIHDAQAIHSIEDLHLASALVFKGTKDTDAAILALTSAKVGDVWLSKASNTEFVCITEINGTAAASSWEKLGNIHDAASSTHKHTVAVTGTNEASTVTVNGNVPTVSSSTVYVGATSAAPTITATGTDKALGEGTTFTVSGGAASNTNVKATATGTAVGANGTAKAITALGTPTTAAAITDLNTTTIKNPTVTKGSAAAWNASVTNGVLEFSFTANKPTTVTTADVTVATGSKTTADAITGFGTHTTADALTGVKVTAQPTISLATGAAAGTGVISVTTGVSGVSVSADTNDIVNTMSGATASAPAITVSTSTSSGTGKAGVVGTVTVGSQEATFTGTAAAQKWNGGTFNTSAPQN